MLVFAWGSKFCSDYTKTIPLWVKFDQIPDCYWTREGLSNLASAIAPPLYVDPLTSKLEILPFAKICVNYTIGEDLPTKLEVVGLDPLTGEETKEEVLVSYPAKPLICTAFKTLGHVVGTCPKAKRYRVRKEPLLS